MSRQLRRRGAQPGNQNARQHGFYAQSFPLSHRREINQALALQGLDDEIALLRTRLKAIIEFDPHDMALITQTTRALSKLVQTRAKLAFLQRFILQCFQDMSKTDKTNL